MFAQNKTMALNSLVLAVTVVNTRLVLTVGDNAHLIFGKRNLIGSFLVLKFKGVLGSTLQKSSFPLYVIYEFRDVFIKEFHKR